MNKLFCLFFVLMILYLIQNKCNVEGFFSLIYKPKACNDDPKWFVENKAGKHYCKNIGKSVSCYDRDVVGREGWEQCLKSCGNCVDTKVSKAPMGVLAGFSGDPYEDFGVVLNMDADRQWVGKTASKTDDIRGYVMRKEQGEDINELQDRLDSMDDIFDLITGNVKTCKTDKGKCGDKDNNKQFRSCDNQCLACPKTTEKASTKKRSYIRQGEDGSIKFPAVPLSCSTVGSSNDAVTYALGKLKSAKDPLLNRLANEDPSKMRLKAEAIIKGGKVTDKVLTGALETIAKNGGMTYDTNTCKSYFLFDKVIDDADKNKDKTHVKDKHKITLHDMCPRECGVEACPSVSQSYEGYCEKSTSGFFMTKQGVKKICENAAGKSNNNAPCYVSKNTASECEQSCTNNLLCRGWTLDKTGGVCYQYKDKPSAKTLVLSSNPVEAGRCYTNGRSK